MAEIPLLNKNCDTEAKNVPACCHEESMSDLSRSLLACATWHQ
jgi:hypothetical protein